MIKDLILNYKIENSAKKRLTQSKNTLTYDKSQHIGIVLTSDNPQKLLEVDRLVADLKADHKEVTLLCFQPKTKEEVFPRPNGQVISKKDLTVAGKWKSQEMIDFINTPFDYLLHLDLERNRYIDYIFAQSNAICRIGPYLDEERHQFELIVSLQEDKYNLKEYISELKKYLKLIGSNEY